MRSNNILVLGGTGFIGRRLVAQLAARGARVCVPTRRRDRARHLILLPTVEVIDADVHDPKVLASLATGREAVVNLVGILHGRSGRADERGPNNYGPDFARAHVELAQSAVNVCRAQGVARLVHVSALGASLDAPSEYLRSKGVGEQVVLAAEDLDVTVFRPSIVYGDEDRFVNLFAALLRYFPVMGVIRPDWRLAPLHVGDVTAALALALEGRDAGGRRHDLCGPRAISMRELVALICAASHRRRLLIGIPDWVARLQAFFLEMLPQPLLSRDNLRSMERDCVSDAPFPYGLQPRSLEAMVAQIQGGLEPRSRYSTLRWRAHR